MLTPKQKRAMLMIKLSDGKLFNILPKPQETNRKQSVSPLLTRESTYHSNPHLSPSCLPWVLSENTKNPDSAKIRQAKSDTVMLICVTNLNRFI